MKVHVLSTPDAVARSLAYNVAHAILAKGSLVLGLPTGRTPIPLYRELAKLHQAGRVSLRRVRTFNLDEFVGVPSSDPRSYHAFMREHLFRHVDLKRSHVHFLDGAAGDVKAECARYERAIARAGGIDLQILGLGANGHIGFNEPGRALVARTHCTALKPATRRANAASFGRLSKVPREALSMGMATILRARRIVLVATGAAKAGRVKGMIEGPVTPALPGSFLQLHADAEVWLDRAAASRLSGAV